jgi:hypothetical protein
MPGESEVQKALQRLDPSELGNRFYTKLEEGWSPTFPLAAVFRLVQLPLLQSLEGPQF